MKDPRPIQTRYSIFKFNLLTSLLSILNRNDENDTDFMIARYFLMNLSRIKNTSIYTVAEQCYVSRSSVQRFIKSIGYDSYKQLKASLDEVLDHENSFVDYTDHVEYKQYVSDNITGMMEDITKATTSIPYRKLVDRFLNSDNVVILTAEDSSHACRLFQQQMLTTGKLIRIVTSANNNLSLLQNLNENDLLLVCSVTGNFALAIDDQIKEMKATRYLITLNKTSVFESTYSLICYLNNDPGYSSRNIVSSRNVFNSYGLMFFFDLFYHDCYIRINK